MSTRLPRLSPGFDIAYRFDLNLAEVLRYGMTLPTDSDLTV